VPQYGPLLLLTGDLRENRYKTPVFIGSLRVYGSEDP